MEQLDVVLGQLEDTTKLHWNFNVARREPRNEQAIVEADTNGGKATPPRRGRPVAKREPNPTEVRCFYTRDRAPAVPLLPRLKPLAHAFRSRTRLRGCSSLLWATILGQHSRFLNFLTAARGKSGGERTGEKFVISGRCYAIAFVPS